MHRAVSSFALLLAALPAVAQSPTIRIGVGCNGPIPVLMEIEATGPAVVHVLMDEIYAYCAREAPTKSHWRTGA